MTNGVVSAHESEDSRRRTISESGAHYTDPDAIRGTSDTEQVGFPSINRSPNGGNKPFDADGAEDTAEGDYGWRGEVSGTLVPHGMDERC